MVSPPLERQAGAYTSLTRLSFYFLRVRRHILLKCNLGLANSPFKPCKGMWPRCPKLELLRGEKTLTQPSKSQDGLRRLFAQL